MKALPKMAKAASDAALKDGFKTHLAETKERLADLTLTRLAEHYLPAAMGETADVRTRFSRRGDPEFPHGSLRGSSAGQFLEGGQSLLQG